MCAPVLGRCGQGAVCSAGESPPSSARLTGMQSSSLEGESGGAILFL